MQVEWLDIVRNVKNTITLTDKVVASIARYSGYTPQQVIERLTAGRSVVTSYAIYRRKT